MPVTIVLLGQGQPNPIDINDAGQVVGQSSMGHAFLWKNGVTTTLATLPGDTFSSVNGVNDQGQVVGYSSSIGTAHAVLWQNGIAIELSNTQDLAFANGINDQGVVVGDANTGGGVLHAVLWQNGATTTLPPLPGAQLGAMSTAWAINDAGQVAGWSMNAQGAEHAVMWQNGRITDIGGLPNALYSQGCSINSAGEVVGQSIMPQGISHAFAWQNGTMSDLGTLPGDDRSSATGNNSAGDIVGWADSSHASSTPSHAVMWRNGQIIDLNTLLPANSGWTLTEADAINDNGQIVGYGTYDGASAMFLMSVNAAIETASNAIQLFRGGELSGEVIVADSAANVQNNLDGLQSMAATGHLSAVSLTDSGTPTVTVTATQLTQDAAALGDISGSHSVVVGGVSVASAQTVAGHAGVTAVSVSDSVANVMGNLGTLETLANAGKLSAIALTDGGTPALTVTPAVLTADSAALGKLAGNFTLSVDASSANVTIAGVAGQASTATFSGKANQYSITPSGDGSSFTVTDTGTGRASTDHLSNISALQFSDGTDIVASHTPPAAGAVSSAQVTELYSAVFGRTPDVAGLAFYQKYAAANSTTPFTQFAKWFLGSAEYTGSPAHAYAQSSAGDAQFITDSYNNLLHRAPASGDAAWYQTNVINPMLAGLTPGTAAYTAAETNAHAQVLAYFSQSPEFLGDVTITAQHPADSQHWLVLV